MDPKELENAVQMLRARAQGGFNARKASDSDLEGLIQGAALLGEGRSQGYADEEVLAKFIQQINNEAYRRNPEQVQSRIESGLTAQGLAPDEGEAKSLAEIVRDESEFGFSDEKLARLAQEQGPDSNNDPLREKIRTARNSRKGKKRDKKLKELNEKLTAREERQIVFDGGVGRIQEPRRVDWDDDELLREFAKDPLNPALEEAVANRSAEITNGRELGMRGQLEGRQGIGDLGPRQRYQGDFRPDGTPLPSGVDKERGMFVLVPDGQGGKKRMWRERGQLFESPDAPANLERRLPDVADELFRPVVVQQPGIDADFRRMLSAENDRAEGIQAVEQFRRFEQDNLTPREMEERARLAAGRLGQEPMVRDVAVGDYAGSEVPGYEYPKRPEGYYRQPGSGDDAVEFDIRPRRKIQRHNFATPVNPDDAQSAILGQLQARKQRGAQGALYRAQVAQQETNRAEAIAALLANAQSGGTPGGTINTLGSVKDKSADMGLNIGNQRVSLGDAYRVVNDDGSVEWVDVNAADIPLAPDKTSQTFSSAEGLNAPTGAENVMDWVQKNQFEDRGAQFFGDEGIISQMNDTGSGGGIEQVDIGGSIGNFEKQVAARLGIEPKRINSMKGMQAAVQAVLANQVQRGNALFRLEGNTKIPAADVPGVAEAMAALKIPPREQKQIANALKQRELANFDRFDARVPGDAAVKPGPNPANVVTGVNDPKRGGDRVQIARDVQYQQKLIAQGADGEAAKPFIGLQVGDKRSIQDNRQVFGGKSPDQVRTFMEDRNRSNREKKVAAAAKKGKKLLPVSMAEERRDAGHIRAMQEGNVFTQMRADREAAKQAAGSTNTLGAYTPAADLGPDPYSGAGQQGRAFPPHPKVKLQPRPVRPQANRTVEDAGEGFRNVQIPEGFTPKQPVSNTRPGDYETPAGPGNTRGRVERRLSQMENLRTNPKYTRGRRIAYGVGGSTAALAGILGLSGDDEEDRREQY